MRLDLTLSAWDKKSHASRDALVGALSRELPLGFRPGCLQTYRLGGCEHDVASFEREGATFVLVPGGDVVLGFDASSWIPGPEERESWRGTAEEYGIERTIEEHVAAVTTRPRSVRVRSCLMETAAREIGWEPVPAEDPRVREVVREHLRPGPSSVEMHRGDAALRVVRDALGGITAHRAESRTHAAFAAELAAAGFGLPTSDEWEHGCGGGATTLFRWGDHAPCDRYPTDVSPEEAAWRRQWVLSGGTLEIPREGFTSDWSLHRVPNAFGLKIASNPYHSELVAELGVSRGGDGGAMICGGAGWFAGWIPLATSWFEDDFCRSDPGATIMAGFATARRVLALD